MTPESPIIVELRSLLDALCEETITPEQLQRLEELVLTLPEAEAFYLRFMNFYADLIGHVTGLPQLPMRESVGAAPAAEAEPRPVPVPKPPKPAPVPLHEPVPVERIERKTSPKRPERHAKKQENSMNRSRSRWAIAAALILVIGGLGGLAASQWYGWHSRTREVAAKEEELKQSREKLAQVQADQKAAQEAARKDLNSATTAEAELLKTYREAHESARKAIEEKDFTVRLTGPAHIQPGAPNKWQIETLRHGAVGRPKKMEVVVKDAKDTEFYRKTFDKPVGAATLELTAGFWEKVKPGSDLFLEVVAYTDDDRKSVIAERLPLARPVYVTHLVIDKPLYKPGETIRFRSLTLDRSSLRPPEHDLHLKFQLRDPADAVVPLDEGNGRLLANLEPVLGPDKKPLRGIGVGEHTLGSDAPGGEYKLDLFEVDNDTRKEVMLETRKFIVNRYVPDTFEKKLEFDGKSYGAGEVVQARIEVSRTAGGPMKDAKANIVASVDGSAFHTLNSEKFSIVTEAGLTKAVLNVRFKLPSDIFEKAKPNTPPNGDPGARTFRTAAMPRPSCGRFRSSPRR